MSFKSIRVKLSIYLGILLFSGMLLISLTAIISFHNNSSEDMAKQLGILFESALKSLDSDKIGSNVFIEVGKILEDLGQSGVCSIQIIDINFMKKEFGSCSFSSKDAGKIMESAHVEKSRQSGFIGKGFYIPFLSERRRCYIVAGPLFDASGSHIATIGIVWSLDVFYSAKVRIDRLLFIYIIINTLVLSAVGVYQIGNITAKPMKRILKKTESVYNDEFSAVKNSGSDFDHLSSSIGFLVDDLASSKKNLQYTVTELEAANMNMKKMQKEIVRAEKMASIGRLSAGLAHEIGNPVGIISGYLEMLKQEEIDDSSRIDFASRANDELKRIDLIIRELLDYARPADQSKTELSVHQLINDLVSVYSGSRAIGNIELKTDLKACFDNVNANYDQLRQVFMNLIINASDAIFDSENKNCGLLTISTSNIINDEGDCKEMMVSFTDNGCGLSGSDLDNIFDPFFTTKPQGKGTGLGLSVSQMIVEDIGGCIKACSIDGHGTEFRIILPLLKAGSQMNE